MAKCCVMCRYLLGDPWWPSQQHPLIITDVNVIIKVILVTDMIKRRKLLLAYSLHSVQCTPRVTSLVPECCTNYNDAEGCCCKTKFKNTSKELRMLSSPGQSLSVSHSPSRSWIEFLSVFVFVNVVVVVIKMVDKNFLSAIVKTVNKCWRILWICPLHTAVICSYIIPSFLPPLHIGLFKQVLSDKLKYRERINFWSD